MASDFAGNRELGAGHGWPSREAQLLEKGFLAGATSDWVKKQKQETAIRQMIVFIEKIAETSLDFEYYYFNIREKLEELLVVEKEQIINSWVAKDNELQKIAAERYYNETYETTPQPRIWE